MSTLLEPYEKVCPDCKGKGFLDSKGEPWEGEVPTLEPGYTHDYSKCWNPACRGGVLLTGEGQALLDFIKRHLDFEVSGQWRKP